jgi:hypothetical protein
MLASRLAVRLLVAAIAVVPALAHATDAETYRTPTKIVADILTAPRVPRGAPSVSPDGARLVLPDLPSLVPIAVLAEPVEKLAGLEILPAMRCTRTQLKLALSGFSVATIAGGAKVRAKLPDGARVGPVVWSARGDRLACALYSEGGAELWIVEAATGNARRLDGVRLNTAVVTKLEWIGDDREILCACNTDEAVGPREASRVPTGPETRIGAGKATPQRTARDVHRRRPGALRPAHALAAGARRRRRQRHPADRRGRLLLLVPGIAGRGPCRGRGGRTAAARVPLLPVPGERRDPRSRRDARGHGGRGSAQRSQRDIECRAARPARLELVQGRPGALVLLVAGHARRRRGEGDP